MSCIRVEGALRTSPHAAEQFLLAVLHQTGHLVKKDGDRAFALCKKAAYRGYKFAQDVLKSLLESCDPAEATFEESVKWHLDTYGGTREELLHDLALQSFLHSYTTEEFERAERLLRRSVELGCLQAHNSLAILLMQKGLHSEAEFHLQYASDRGHDMATYNLAMMKMNGIGVRRDLTLGLNLLQQAADNNLPEAEDMMGHVFYSGAPGFREPDSAVIYYERAFRHGSAVAPWALIEIYTTNQSLLNRQRAYTLSKQLAAEGSIEAQFTAAALSLVPEVRNYDDCLFWCTVAAQNGHAQADTIMQQWRAIEVN